MPNSVLDSVLPITSSTPSYPNHSMGEFKNLLAFAAIKNDGSVVTWGDPSTGGGSVVFGYKDGAGFVDYSVADQLDGRIDVAQVFSNERAFAALRADGSVVTWGDSYAGGRSSVEYYDPYTNQLSAHSVADQLNGTIDVVQVFSTKNAFAALRADGSVVTWGDSATGGDSSNVASKLDGTVDVTQIFSNDGGFAALRADGSVVTWGGTAFGGNSSVGYQEGGQWITDHSVANLLDGSVDVVQIFSTKGAFAALRADGSVVTWGDEAFSGNSSAVATKLDGTIDVVQIFSTDYAFAALRSDGSVVTWNGDDHGGFSHSPTYFYGGDSSNVAGQLDGTIDVTQVFSNARSFAALRADGSVVTWGDRGIGGESYTVSTQLDGTIDVTQIFSTGYAFAALRADGSVVIWGSADYGGSSRSVAAKLDGTIDATQIFSTDYAFAALLADGSVVTWGRSDYGGGDSSNVASKLDGTIDVTQVFSTGIAFAALRADGSVVTWGKVEGSSDVAKQISSGVVTLADIYSNLVFVSPTTDTNAPVISMLFPADNAANIPVASNFLVTFNEAIKAGKGNIVIYNANGLAAKTISITDNSQISIAGITLRINPSVDLAPGSNYYIAIDKGAIQDLAGNPFSGISDNNTWSFKTFANSLPTGSVSINGNPTQGETLTINITLSDADGLGPISYQWLRDSNLISGANGETYQTTQQDVGHRISFNAMYTDGFGTLESVFSSNALSILPRVTVNSQSVDTKGNLAGTTSADVFDGTKKPNATLLGGQGDDSYLIDNPASKIKEATNQGVDTVYSSVSFTLPNNVENLRLTGNANINAKGNTLNNLLVGNDGNNSLFGLSGNDILTGQEGSDRFVFDSTPNIKKNIDTITDFKQGEDLIALSAKLFKKLGPTVDISDIWFKNSENVQSQTGFLVYDSTTGVLAYDADGNGNKAAIQIALIGINEHPDLQASDFMMV